MTEQQFTPPSTVFMKWKLADEGQLRIQKWSQLPFDGAISYAMSTEDATGATPTPTPVSSLSENDLALLERLDSYMGLADLQEVLRDCRAAVKLVQSLSAKDSSSSKMRVTDERVEAARFTLSGICGFAITSATVRRTLESAISATATEAS